MELNKCYCTLAHYKYFVKKNIIGELEVHDESFP